MQPGKILWEEKDHIGQITFNSPPLNAMKQDFFNQFSQIIIEKTARPDLEAIILCSQGRHFSAGADLDELLECISRESSVKNGSIVRYPDYIKQNEQLFIRLNELKLPLLAAVKGVCLGSAFELILFCHFRICARGSLFCLPETVYHLMPGCGGIQKLMQYTSCAHTLDLVLRGDTFSCQKALQLGLVDQIVPRNELMDTTWQWAKKAALNYRALKKRSL